MLFSFIFIHISFSFLLNLSSIQLIEREKEIDVGSSNIQNYISGLTQSLKKNVINFKMRFYFYIFGTYRMKKSRLYSLLSLFNYHVFYFILKCS